MGPFIIIMGIFLILIMTGIPVAYGFVLTAAIYIPLEGGGIPWTVIAARGITLVSESYTLLAVPLFILAAALMNEAGMTDRLVRFALAAVGHVKGGIGHAVIGSNVMMAGMSGSATADAAGIGKIMIPALRRAGYSAPSAAALSASAATIGPIIPPSVAMVLYSTLASISLGSLMLGGVVPGLLMALCLSVGLFLSKEAGRLKRSKFNLRVLLASSKDAVLSLLMPLIIMGGMFLGVYTPTEGASVAVLYGAVVGFCYRSLTLRRLWTAFIDTAVLSGAVLLVVMGANAVSWLLTAENAGESLRKLFLPFSTSSGLTLLIIALMTLILGTAIEEVTMLILMTPIFAPIVVSMGIDPIQFGLVFIMATMIGLITPPVGISMFISCQIAQVSTMDFTKAVIRPFLAMLTAVVLCCFFPEIVVWLPRLVGA
jgi:C4-dicarboxylate transporter DctM subunit